MAADSGPVLRARAPVRPIDDVSERATAEVLRHAVLIFGRTVGLVGLFWAVVGLRLGDVAILAIGALAVAFGGWLVLERRRSNGWSAARLATRIAVVTQVASILAVTIEPVIGPGLALGSLIPVVVALVYVDRRTLTVLMLASAAVGTFAVLAPSMLPWAGHGTGALDIALPSSTLVVVYVLFQVFLWNASTRLTDTAADLQHVVSMSRDLAGTMDPADVGHQLARHLRMATSASECTLSTWNQASNRVETFGFDPPDFASRVEAAYELDAFPMTERVLTEQHALVIDANDPLADVAEVAYLRSIERRRSLMIPLVVRGDSIGIVELTSNERNAFDVREVALAQLLAGEAALTFDNARLHGEIKDQALSDPLTGLANRSRFQERVEHSLARLRRSPRHAAVLFIDLDHFKHVNDRFGHTAGDRLLKAVAQRVGSSVRPGDTAARLGGDEFAILLEDVEGKDEAEAVCRRILDGVAEPIALGPASPTIGASIGVAISGFGGETVDELLRNADIAMYAAKAAGRGQVVFFRSELLDLASARSELAALLRGAEARGELQLHFQPIVALENGAPVGLEALVRWQPQGHALHMPAEFIGLAEETGEILNIGRWVLAEACRRAREWQQRFNLPDLRVYVNLSARQFRDAGLLGIVGGALRDAGLAPEHLTLEITETALLTRTPETLSRIGQLRRLGVRLAIDDFGTGYSSLGYLHAFQVDELKIDRSFVSGTSAATSASPRRDAKVLSRAIVELGRALSLEMVAEGIETATQAEWFRQLGCRYGQGFHFARPLAPEEVERFLRRRRRLPRVAPTDRPQAATMPAADRAPTPAGLPPTATGVRGARTVPPRPRLPRPHPITPPARSG